MTDITRNNLDSLAAKLDGLDLTEAEATILTEILQRAAGTDEVSGFSGLDLKTRIPDGFAPLMSRINVKLPGFKST